MSSLTVSACITTAYGASRTRNATVAVLVVAAAVYGAAKAGWVRSAAATIFGLWLSVAVAVLFSVGEVPTWIIDVWFVMLILAYAAVQLEPAWFGLALVLGSAGWAALVRGDHGDPSVLRFISIAGTTGLSVLAFVAQRRFVLELESLRLKDMEQREVLASALRAAERELEERQRLEAEREALRTRFISAQRLEAMGQVAGRMAHEINNILAGVLGLAEVMKSDAVEPSTVEDLDAMIAGCRRGGELTRALLRFGRHGTVELTPISLDRAMTEIEPMLRRASPPGISLRIQIDGPLPRILGSEPEMGQAIMNLCLNAFQASPKTEVLVEVASVDLPDAEAAILDLSAGRYVRLTVTDDGEGMPPEVVSRAMEPFFTTKAQGTGLGLAQVYGTAKSMRGTMSIRSGLGSGTSISIYARADVDVDAGAAVASTVARPRPDRATRVLLADDDPMVRSAMRRALARAGLEVTAVADGESAIDAALSASFDVVLLDVSMPGIGGIGALTRIRAERPALPVVVLSGHVDDALVARLLAAGAGVVLTKPIPVDELLQAIERECASRRADA
ncbi:MAG: response regulator [Deltaproteobacteria bacterium]|nr:response regulator [Deltaproteobacteria bacterium]